MIQVFGYGRASTDKQRNTEQMQAENTASYFHLQQSIGKWGEDYKWLGFFFDKAVSGKTEWHLRPFGNYIFTHAQAGDVIVVANYDRAFRSLTDLLVVYDRLQERGIRMIIMDMDFDMSGPLGKALMRILAVIKELEREETARRTNETVKHVQGKRGTWGAKLGWRLVPSDPKNPKSPKIVVPDRAMRKLGAWVADKVDNEGWTIQQCWRHLAFEKGNAMKGKYVCRQKLHTLYTLHKEDWPRSGQSYTFRRPCRETTAS